MGAYQWAEGNCTDCGVSMVWLPGSFGQPDAAGRCSGSKAKSPRRSPGLWRPWCRALSWTPRWPT